MEEKYKGYRIRYLEDLGRFRADIGDSEYDNESLSKVKKYIDRLEKKDFVRVDVLVDTYRNDYDKAVVTSEVSDYDDFEVWVTFKKGKRRQKFLSRTVFLDNEKNQGIIDSIEECNKEIDAFGERKMTLREQLDRYVPVSKRE